MHNIQQLKSIRDEAFQRLQTNPDYKLLTSLDSLIIELEGVIAIGALAEKSVSQATPSKPIEDNSYDKALNTLANSNSKTTITDKPKTPNAADLTKEINGGVSLS